jgi:hypothetical protein
MGYGKRSNRIFNAARLSSCQKFAEPLYCAALDGFLNFVSSAMAKNPVPETKYPPYCDFRYPQNGGNYYGDAE